MWITILYSFLIGGVVCLLGQLLINYTHITSSRILVLFLLIGVGLEAFGLFDPIKEFAGGGVTVPIMGFGSNLAKGAIEGAKIDGLLGAIGGGLSKVGPVLAFAIGIGFIIALISKSKTKA